LSTDAWDRDRAGEVHRDLAQINPVDGGRDPVNARFLAVVADLSFVDDAGGEHLLKIQQPVLGHGGYTLVTAGDAQRRDGFALIAEITRIEGVLVADAVVQPDAAVMFIDG